MDAPFQGLSIFLRDLGVLPLPSFGNASRRGGKRVGAGVRGGDKGGAKCTTTPNRGGSRGCEGSRRRVEDRYGRKIWDRSGREIEERGGRKI